MRDRRKQSNARARHAIDRIEPLQRRGHPDPKQIACDQRRLEQGFLSRGEYRGRVERTESILIAPEDETVLFVPDRDDIACLPRSGGLLISSILQNLVGRVPDDVFAHGRTSSGE